MAVNAGVALETCGRVKRHWLDEGRAGCGSVSEIDRAAHAAKRHDLPTQICFSGSGGSVPLTARDRPFIFGVL